MNKVIAHASRPSRPHEQVVVQLLRRNPKLADEYLAQALAQTDEEGGRQALLTALRQVAEAQGMSEVAGRAGIARESLYRALSTRGNPTIKTLLAVLQAVGLRLSVVRV